MGVSAPRAPLQAKRAALHCGALLDPEGDSVSRDVFVVRDCAVVKQILRAGGASQISAGAKQVDASKGFCLPGLIDVHHHLTVKAGSFADIIAVDSDPRANVAQLQHVRFVTKEGTIYPDKWDPPPAVRK